MQIWMKRWKRFTLSEHPDKSRAKVELTLLAKYLDINGFLTCGIHLEENFKNYCCGNQQIINSLFGIRDGAFKKMGLFDEKNFDTFYAKVIQLKQTDLWKAHEKLINWASSEVVVLKHFRRYNLSNCGRLGFQFRNNECIRGTKYVIKINNSW